MLNGLAGLRSVRQLRVGPFRRGFPGAVEPPAAVLAPSVGTTTPSRRQHKLGRNKLPSDTVTLDNAAWAGNLLLLYIAANGPLTIGVPTGWTAVTGLAHTTGTGVSQVAFWKVAAGGETSVSWSATAGTATATSALLVEVQDAHATAPVIEGVQSVVNAGTATRASGAASAAATTYANELALAFWGAQAGSSVDATTARGFSGSVDTLIFATGADAAPPLALGSRLLPTTGTIPSTEWTWTGDAADENILGLVRVRPHEVFNPASLFAGAEAGDWLLASDTPRIFTSTAGTGTPASGEAAARWDGARGVVSMRQATASVMPLWHTAGGVSWFEFSGRYFTSAAALNLSGSDEVTVVVGIYKTSDATVGQAVRHDAAGALIYLNAPGTASAAGYTGVVDSAALSVTAGYAAGNAHVVSIQSKVATDLAKMRVNGVEVASSAVDLGANTFGNASLWMGRSSGGTATFYGRIYGLLIIGRVLTASELAQAETWMANESGAVF